MTDTYNFEVGPADDAENLTVMTIGLEAKKSSLRSFKKMMDIVQKTAPECSPKQGVGYQWQGMIALAGYSLALTQAMLTQVGWEWKQGQAATLQDLADQTNALAQKFLASQARNQ